MTGLDNYLSMPLDVLLGVENDIATLKSMLEGHPIKLFDSDGMAFAVVLPLDAFESLCREPSRITLQ